MGVSINTNLSNENQSDHIHVTCPYFCVIKKMLPTITLTLQRVFIEASKSMSALKTTHNI